MSRINKMCTVQFQTLKSEEEMKIFSGVKCVYALLIAALALGAFGAPPVKADEGTGTIVDVALAANAETGEFSILIAALQAANPLVLQRLSSEKQSTVFAPTDAAFQALLDELGVTAEQLLSNQFLVTKVLRYHIVRGNLDSTEVLARESLRTLRGGRIAQNNGVLTDANGRTANIIQTDIQASNGVIHVIDRVLLPKIDRITEPEIENTIVDVVLAANEETGEFSSLIAALEAARPSVLERLSSEKQSTVFAPTDAAFQALLDELGVTAEELLSNRHLVTNVLRYHIVRGNLDSTEVLAMESLRNLRGGRIAQNNGVLTDVNGRTANIIQTDIQASNGVIHVIDRVLLPKIGGMSEPEIENTIVDVTLAVNEETGEFSSLIAALEAADPSVIERLSSKKQSTVFAPTDAAFASLLAELGVTQEQLLADQALLTQVLLYHVAPGNRDSEDVLESKRIRTLQGGHLSQANGVLTDANGRTANIIQTDIQASNGVIHVIDRVLLPDLTPDSK
jgi:transforming growth factor-beta-induced protein